MSSALEVSMKALARINHLIHTVMLMAAVSGLFFVQAASGQTCVNGGACNPSSLDNIVFVDGATYPA
jgi:hypothetical protein